MDVKDFPYNSLVCKRGNRATRGRCKGASPVFPTHLRVVWAGEAARGSTDWDLVLPENLELVPE